MSHLSDDAKLARDLCAIESGLTDWEVGFIESITNQIDRGRDLSDRQREVAEKILGEKGEMHGT